MHLDGNIPGRAVIAQFTDLYQTLLGVFARKQRDQQADEDEEDELEDPRLVGVAVRKVGVLSVLGVGTESDLAALRENVAILVAVHDLLKVVAVKVIPGQVTVALPRRVRLDDDSIRHRQRDLDPPLDAAEEEGSFYFQVRQCLQRVPVRVEA